MKFPTQDVILWGCALAGLVAVLWPRPTEPSVNYIALAVAGGATVGLCAILVARLA